MKIKFDKPRSMYTTAIELSASQSSVDLEMAIRYLNIYKPFTVDINEKIAVVKNIVSIYVKLLVQKSQAKEKLTIFIKAVLELMYLLKPEHVYNEIETAEEEFSTSMKILFEMLESLRVDGFELLMTADFRDAVLSRYGNTELLKFLENNPNKTTNIIYNRFAKQEDIYTRAIELISKCFEKLHRKSSIKETTYDDKDEVPELDVTFSEVNFGQEFEDDYYFEAVRTIEEKEKEGMVAFVKYLLDNYEIILNGNVIRQLDDDAIEANKDPIFRFFKNTKFKTRIENDITHFILKVIERNGWLDEN